MWLLYLRPLGSDALGDPGLRLQPSLNSLYEGFSGFCDAESLELDLT